MSVVFTENLKFKAIHTVSFLGVALPVSDSNAVVTVCNRGARVMVTASWALCSAPKTISHGIFVGKKSPKLQHQRIF